MHEHAVFLWVFLGMLVPMATSSQSRYHAIGIALFTGCMCVLIVMADPESPQMDAQVTSYAHVTPSPSETDAVSASAAQALSEIELEPDPEPAPEPLPEDWYAWRVEGDELVRRIDIERERHPEGYIVVETSSSLHQLFVDAYGLEFRDDFYAEYTLPDRSGSQTGSNTVSPRFTTWKYCYDVQPGAEIRIRVTDPGRHFFDFNESGHVDDRDLIWFDAMLTYKPGQRRHADFQLGGVPRLVEEGPLDTQSLPVAGTIRGTLNTLDGNFDGYVDTKDVAELLARYRDYKLGKPPIEFQIRPPVLNETRFDGGPL